MLEWSSNNRIYVSHNGFDIVKVLKEITYWIHLNMMSRHSPNSSDFATLREIRSKDSYAKKDVDCSEYSKVRQTSSLDDLRHSFSNSKKLLPLSGCVYAKPDVFVRDKYLNDDDANNASFSSFRNFSSCQLEHVRNNAFYRGAEMEPFKYSKPWLESSNRHSCCLDKNNMIRVFDDTNAHPLLGDDSDENEIREDHRETFLYPWMRTQYGIIKCS